MTLLASLLQNVAASCLYLAGKLEEQTSLKARAVLTVMDRIVSRREGRSMSVLEPGTKVHKPVHQTVCIDVIVLLSRSTHSHLVTLQEYDRAKGQLVKHERLLLKEFGFVTMVDHPHKYVFNLIEMVAKKRIGDSILPGHECYPLLQEAWHLLNDR